MREMFRQAFAAITILFRSVERTANALDSCAKWAEAEAAHFEHEAALERAAQLKVLQDKLLTAVPARTKAA